MASLLKATCILSVFLSISFSSAHRFLSDQATEPLHHGAVKKINPNGGKGVGAGYGSGGGSNGGSGSGSGSLSRSGHGVGVGSRSFQDPCGDFSPFECQPCDKNYVDDPCCYNGYWNCLPHSEHQGGSATAAAKEVQEASNIAGEEPPTDHDHYNKVSESYPPDHAHSKPSITITGNAQSKPAAVSITGEPYPPDHAHSKP